MMPPTVNRLADKYGIPEKPVKNRCVLCGTECGGGRKVHQWCWVASKRRAQRAAKK